MAVRLSYPTLLPGPSTYQSSMPPSFGTFKLPWPPDCRCLSGDCPPGGCPFLAGEDSKPDSGVWESSFFENRLDMLNLERCFGFRLKEILHIKSSQRREVLPGIPNLRLIQSIGLRIIQSMELARVALVIEVLTGRLGVYQRCGVRLAICGQAWFRHCRNSS